MRLHRLAFVASAALGITAAHADPSRVDPQPKPLESTTIRTPKTRAIFSLQAQLFVEQKEAPANSKTALRLETAGRFSAAKSKD